VCSVHFPPPRISTRQIQDAKVARDDARESVRKAEVDCKVAVADLKAALATRDPIAIEIATKIYTDADASLRVNQRLLEQAQASLDMLFQQQGVKSAGKLRMNSFSVFI
jgi:hypothetical protein